MTGIRHYLYILLFLLLSSNALFAQADSMVITIDNNIETPLDLNKYTYIYSTTDTNSKIESVINNEFRYSPNGVKGINRDTIYWKQYKFYNPSKDTINFYIYIPYSIINKVIAYSEHSNKTEHITSLGMLYKRADKEINAIGYPIPITLAPGKTNIYIYIKIFNLALRTNSFLVTKEVLIDTVMADERIIWFWKGIFLITTIIAFSLFLVTRIRMFLFYLLLNIGMGVYFFAEMGDITKYIEISPFNITVLLKTTSILLAFISFPLLINQIVPIAKLRPRIWRFMYYVLSIVVLSWLAILIPHFLSTKVLFYTTIIYNYYAPFMLILQMYLVFVAFRAKVNNSKYLFVGYSGYIMAMFLYAILPNLGLIKPSLHIYNTFIYGSLFEIIMFMSLIGKETLFVYSHRSSLLEKQKEHQTDIINAIVKSQESERDRLGKEIHDMIGTNISVIKQNIDASNKPLIEIIDRTIKHTRDLSHGLVTPMIKNDEFVDEIDDLCTLFSQPDFSVKSSFFNWKRACSEEKIVHLYRIIQELLNNAVKHSKASNVLLQFISNDNDEIIVMYEDDGIGFDYKSAYYDKGLGLINIENRVKLIDAKIIFDTVIDKGTTIIIELNKKS